MRASVLTCIALCGLLLASVGRPSVAQPRSNEPPAVVMDSVRSAFNRFAYDVAEQRARAALADFDRFTPDQLAELHSLRARMAYADGRMAEAREQFVAALTIVPELTLDPLLVSPKIIAYFEEVKADWLARQASAVGGQGGVAATPRYVVVQDPRPAAALRSMVLPGWGQLYKGERTKGWLLVGLWTGTGTATALAHVARGRAEEAYLEERTPAEVAGRYATYNRRHKWRNNLALATAALWVLSYVDALTTDVRPVSGLQVGVGVRADRPALRVQISW